MARTSSNRGDSARLLILALSLSGLLLALSSTQAIAPCALPDLPSCVCYATCSAVGAPWPPSLSGNIVDVAREMVGLRTCCFQHMGQAYWQIQRQATIPECAEALAFENPTIETDEETVPAAWCTESVAYWAERSNTPYPQGYYSASHHPSSYVESARKMREWYTDEEALLGTARGRWIDGTELDYANFEPGVNGPCPGAYQQIYKYDETDADGDGTPWDNTLSHSQLVDSMVVVRLGGFDGPVIRIDVHMVEGNIGFGGGSIFSRVVNTNWYVDIVQFTALGHPDTVIDSNDRKIRGWGVNLNADGTVNYDPGRIGTLVQHSVRVFPPPTGPENSDAQHVAQMLAYYQATGGNVSVSSNSSFVQTGGALPTETGPWVIPPGPHPADPVCIDIDLLAQHPYSVKAVTIDWIDGPPPYFEVWWSGVPVQIQKRFVTIPTGAPSLPPGTVVPFAVALNPNVTNTGFPVRYARICIPRALITRTYAIQGFHYNFYADDVEDNNGVSPGGGAGGTDVRDGGAPSGAWLASGVPNPFQGTTRLTFGLPSAGFARLEVYDVHGRRVRALSASVRSEGTHVVEWDGRDDRGHGVASGIYFVRLEWQRHVTSQKLVIIR